MNGWSRVPDTLQARCQVEDYFRRPVRRAPWVRVLRVARRIEIDLLYSLGLDFTGGDLRLSETREALDPGRDWDDVWNDAIKLVHRRRREREEARKNTPSWERVTHELTPSGDLRPLA